MTNSKERGFLLLVVAVLVSSRIVPTTVYAKDDSAKPHFVFVHGIGHGAWCWYKVVSMLKERGFGATAIDLASAGRDKLIADNIQTLADYTKPVTDFLANVTDSEVIVVGHSLGGVGATYVSEQYGGSRIRKTVFLAGLMPKNNETAFHIYPPQLASAFPENILVAYAANASNPLDITSIRFGSNTTGIINALYNQSPREDIALSFSMLVPTPYGPLVEPLILTAQRYGRVRRFYVRTGQDHSVPLPVQQQIMDNNPPDEVFLLPESDHSAFFTVPKELTDVLVHIASL